MTKRPNVLLITTDQWPGALLGLAGHPVIQTPTIDLLAQNGVYFPNSYSECPICIPARRTLMTGTSPARHGDRTFRPSAPMPDLPTLAGSFKAAGYQAFAVGKLHVYPPRDRIGFDDVLLAEEGRPQLGAIDDYELFLADQGFVGQQFMGGMTNNDYVHRPWHLPEHCHVTGWTTMQMARTIKRRDPTRPAFWYLSYTHPHPPLAPLACYLDLYRDREIDAPIQAPWSENDDRLPWALQRIRRFWRQPGAAELASIRRAFYALCTHIDHQLRVIVGTLREEQLLDDTIVLFTSDHGDMLGDFGLWAKRVFYEGSARVPMILMDRARDARIAPGTIDPRLVGLQDVMPTLLELCGIPPPQSVDGISMIGEPRREHLYGESLEDGGATRMVRDERHKLIWYPAGNRLQLFDLLDDPQERFDRADDPAQAPVRRRLEERLIGELYGIDRDWVRDGRLIGHDTPPARPVSNRALHGQRGLHYPQPPQDDPARVVGTPGN